MLFHTALAEGDIRNISSYYTGGSSALEGQWLLLILVCGGIQYD